MTKEITGWKDELKGALEEMGNVPARRFYDIMEKFINHQIASAVEARESKIGEHILAIGHNDECMFCGFKDKFATSIINPSKE